MRKRYFARSLGAIADQPSSNAPRAASTASADVLGPGVGDLRERLLGGRADRRLELARLGSTNSPPMKSP